MCAATKCVLIDNDEDDQEIFLTAIKEINRHIHCRVADSGKMAIEMLADDQLDIPEFIFIDMNMPLMNGKQCLQEIRKLNHLIDTPVYMYSTAADPHSIEEVKNIAATDFIVKPASFKDLVTLLSGIFEKNQSVLL
ncbi:MAG TPA: response regulator [Flavisolibacter sp.]|nr:response regulator [Flavisolibacter sp.]